MFTWMMGLYCAIAAAGYLAIVKYELDFSVEELGSVIKFIAAHLLLMVLALLWPLVILAVILNFIFPHLFKESSILGVNGAIQSAQEEMEDLRASPPYCTNTILFYSELSRSELKGKFYFSALDALQADNLKNVTGEVSRLNQEPIIKKWLLNRNEADSTPVSVPAELDRFEFIALDLIKAGKGEVICPECEQKYSNNLLKVIDDEFGVGWNGIQISCPQEHLLFYPLTMHIMGIPSWLTKEESN
ncbi:hypothetical protein [Colwellia sp. RSH04]|uniref:hypothetical protein n=1 Tax=Colwellia sp. RSH04 TaxID=2305464 RepID=UPI000E56D1D6|nr:hypothetical protein [Colwellia sp. RSH04]RHW76108.1 hypothetical protein D1094_10630 [Colwellia sp. RSH04]